MRNSHTKVNNVFEYTIGGGHTTTDTIAYGHPALMHEQLVEDMITSWSNPGDLVFDPFTHAGTTATMEMLNRRRFIGTKTSNEYCDIANARWFSHKPSILEATNDEDGAGSAKIPLSLSIRG